jgi:NADH:ubiquinone oxidoreductase subunit F (NADH-binding)/NADH:ubiquinone oxidoreductase subunit E
LVSGAGNPRRAKDEGRGRERARRRPPDAEISALAARHGGGPEALFPVLRALQAERACLRAEDLSEVARALRLPPERAYGVASFYSLFDLPPRARPVMRLCDGPVCWTHGADAARERVVEAYGAAWAVERTSCLGLCDLAPAAFGEGRQLGPLTAENLPELPVAESRPSPTYATPLPGELRVVMARAGLVDPDSLESALSQGAYRALAGALEQPPETVLAAVEASGLQGRGGAGFPVGRKWRMVAAADGSPKYVVCNADESEPLVFKDRVLLDADPHAILEGMALAAYAVGADTGFIYIRGEYTAQADRIERAVRAAEAAGWLGEKIAGSTFTFRVHVHRGAGAYICGEETALLASLEGGRGEPRLRPPYPPAHGYRGQPTLVNNVETLAAVPPVVANGGAWYREIGPPASPGTKLYTLLGAVDRPGLFEAPLGLTLRRIIDEFGGGMAPGSAFQLALVGGAAGAFLPPALLDLPLDYTSGPRGAAIGAGGILVCDQSVSPVALLRQLVHFFAEESCGKCTPCRIGTFEARAILDRLLAGSGRPTDTERLAVLAESLEKASFCGLGQSAALPIKSALRHFPASFPGAAPPA